MESFVLGTKNVLLNFNEYYCKSESEVLSSQCLKEVFSRYVDYLTRNETTNYLEVLNICVEPKLEFVDLFKLLLIFSVDDIKKMSPFYKMVLEHNLILHEIVEDFYDYWRRLQRYATFQAKNNIDGINNNSFIEATNNFSGLILKTYRTISQKILGKSFNIYRQLPAGVNAALLTNKYQWMSDDNKYSNLKDVNLIEQIIIIPPFITYSNKNTRSGIYKEAKVNKVANLKINSNEYFLFPCYVGDLLAFIYFHIDFLCHGIALGNLFEFVNKNQIVGKKPDLIYLFGAPINEESSFYYDKEEDIYVGIAPKNDSVDYFGYLKKMLLTLHNIKMINMNYLPIHGACVSIKFKDNKTKNIVIIGDSGAGKSETLEALNKVAKDDIIQMITVFDDMGTFRIKDNQVKAQGTEIGAFVRLDDMSSGYAYKEMDRAIFMNPDKINSRLVILVSTYQDIIKPYDIDMVLYANNYNSNLDKKIDFFENKEDALEVFITGARNAKGTTSEVGLVKSFFANPFGPVQREEETRILLDKYFDMLFENNIKVGQIYTKLSINGYEQIGPCLVAKELFEILKK